jgi:methylenetetrahydrofolate reductase (NADPH)
VRLTVTCSPTLGLDHTVAVAVQLQPFGHAVTVHLPARMVRDRAHLDALLVTIAQAGVDDIFVIGGDSPAPHGPYSSAVELLPIIYEHSRRPRIIGIAGYPEGHTLIDGHRLDEALRIKSQLADYIVTQLCFNPKTVLAWIEEIRRMNIVLPVFVGLPGAVSRRKLLEISARIGVGPSLSFLRKQGLGNLMRLSANFAEGLYQSLSPMVGNPLTGISGFHYFTFNRLVATWRWMRTHSSEPVHFTAENEETR